MERKKSQNSCVRVVRDEQQIMGCKRYVEAVDGQIQDFSQVLKLAGNEVRMKILILLQKEERLCVCDLGEILDMKIPAVSQHLRKLKDGNLLLTEREGTTIFYSINPYSQPVLSSLFRGISECDLVLG